MSDMPTWTCASDGPLGAYEQGLVCGTCKKRFGTIFVMSNGTPHQWVDGATCSECFRKAVLSRPEYEHAKAMLKWLNGKEPEGKETKHG